MEGDPFWDGIRDAVLGKPSNQTQECHHPKPILLSTGEVRHQHKRTLDVDDVIVCSHTAAVCVCVQMNWPLPWHPQIVDVQIVTIGSVAVVAVPGEMT